MKIYKLENEDGLIYIGKTTCKYLSSRLAVHKSQALTERNINKCKSKILFDNNKKVKIELLEITEDSNRELYYIEKYNCVNKMKTGLSYKETKKNWNEKNPEYYKNYFRKTQRNKKKYKCFCGTILCITSKSRHEKSQIHKNNIIYNKWVSLTKSVLIKNMDLN